MVGFLYSEGKLIKLHQNILRDHVMGINITFVIFEENLCGSAELNHECHWLSLYQ